MTDVSEENEELDRKLISLASQYYTSVIHANSDTRQVCWDPRERPRRGKQTGQLFGRLLRFRVQGISKKILKRVSEQSKKKSSIVRSWMTDDAVYLYIGSEYWPMTKKGGLQESRVLTVENNEPSSSHRHVPLVELRIGGALFHGPFSRSYQEIVWFLRSLPRLSPVDISCVIEEVDASSRGHAQLGWKYEHSMCLTIMHTGKNGLLSS